MRDSTRGATERMPAAKLRDMARRGSEQLENCSAQDVLRWAIDEFDDRVCIAASMENAVLIHMAATIRPRVPVVFIDTGYHFAETLAVRDAVAAAYDVEVVTLRPAQSVDEQDRTLGPRLHERDPDRCCALRKLKPFYDGLSRYDAWLSGVRRDETSNRRGMRVVEWDAHRQKIKVNPLVSWRQEDVDRYVEQHGLVVHPLLKRGYPSIGCRPCTSPVASGEDPRSGRWRGTSKTECGLHA